MFCPFLLHPLCNDKLTLDYRESDALHRVYEAYSHVPLSMILTSIELNLNWFLTQASVAPHSLFSVSDSRTQSSFEQ